MALEANETSSVPETSSIPQTSNVERNTSSLPVSYFEYYNRLVIKVGYNLDVNHNYSRGGSRVWKEGGTFLKNS